MVNHSLSSRKKRHALELNNGTGYVSSTEDDLSVSSASHVLGSKIDRLTQMMIKMGIRIQSLENKLEDQSSDAISLEHLESIKTSAGTEKLKSQFSPSDESDSLMSDKYILFRAKEINPKGGLYTHDHLTQIYLTDEKMEGLIVDETRCYFRVRMRGEAYLKGVDGRLKSKRLVRPLRVNKN